MLGVSGCGKRSVTRLAASMMEFRCVELEISKTYGVTEFREDLKKFFNLAGVQDKPIVFMLNDNQIVQEEFLEDINNILNSGEVPGLYGEGGSEEYEKLMSDISPVARKAGVGDNRDDIYEYFVERVRANLHVVLCMSPVGEQLRTRCRMFPSLINCSTIDCFDEWPRAALLSVSRHLLCNQQQLQQQASPQPVTTPAPVSADGTTPPPPATPTPQQDINQDSPETNEKIAQLCYEVHSSSITAAAKFEAELSRLYYITPAAYLTLVNLYQNLLSKKRSEIGKYAATLRSGLAKLSSANQAVEIMKSELSALQPKLTRKALATEQLMKQLRDDQEKVDSFKRVVLKKEQELKIEADKAEALANDAKADLDKAQPELEAAEKSLVSLDPRAIHEIRGMAQPPELVRTTMEAVCILLQHKGDNNWAAAKQVLQDGQFLNKLIKFDREHVPEDVLRKLKKYIDNPAFVPATVARHSVVAAMSLCLWVRAINRFSYVFKEVEPKRIALQSAEAELESARTLLEKEQAKLAEIERQLEELRNRYEESLSEKTSLANEIQLTSVRIKRSSQLTTGLAEEKVLWAEKLAGLEAQFQTVVGDAFLSAAAISYLGPFTSEYRRELMERWIAACKNVSRRFPQFNLANRRATPAQVRDWTIMGASIGPALG